MLLGEAALSIYDTNPEFQVKIKCIHGDPDVRPWLHAHLGRYWPTFCKGSRDTVVTPTLHGPDSGRIDPGCLLTRTGFQMEGGHKCPHTSLFLTVRVNANLRDMNMSLNDQHESASVTSCLQWATSSTPLTRVPTIPHRHCGKLCCCDTPKASRKAAFSSYPQAVIFKCYT